MRTMHPFLSMHGAAAAAAAPAGAVQPAAGSMEFLKPVRAGTLSILARAEAQRPPRRAPPPAPEAVRRIPLPPFPPASESRLEPASRPAATGRPRRERR